MRAKRKNLKTLPPLGAEDDEIAFWDTHDSTDYVDWSKAQRGVLLPNLKPSSQTISLRLPVMMVEQLKTIANKRDVPYQSLLKMFVAERLESEFGRAQPRKTPIRRAAAKLSKSRSAR
jgi:predicted DNA binding CopG/RHH family protein